MTLLKIVENPTKHHETIIFPWFSYGFHKKKDQVDITSRGPASILTKPHLGNHGHHRKSPGAAGRPEGTEAKLGSPDAIWANYHHGVILYIDIVYI